MKQTWMVGILILTCLAIGGCGTESERLANLADRTIEMQSRQNSTIAKTTREMAQLNRDVQSERNELSLGLKQLDLDRREIHKERRSELAWAESFQFLAIVIAASMPLFLCAYLIWSATQTDRDAELINEVLLQELVAERPRLIAGPNHPVIEQQRDVKNSKHAKTLNIQNEENN